MKDIIISEKARERKLSEGPTDRPIPAEVAKVSSLIDVARKYRWAIGNIDMDTAKKLGLTGVKKY